jgi:hypothetical protein
MRYKVVPEPVADREALATAQRAVPLVPDTVEDCCSRLRDRCGLASRDRARELLTFLEALDLVTETERGYRRTEADPDPQELAPLFEERVFGAREITDALADSDGPLAVDEAFAVIREAVPQWERNRSDDWEGEWRDRVHRLLEWAVLFGLATEADEGYVDETAPE